MLCFLPPLPKAPDPRPEPLPPISDAALVFIVLLAVVCAALAPFGW